MGAKYDNGVKQLKLYVKYSKDFHRQSLTNTLLLIHQAIIEAFGVWLNLTSETEPCSDRIQSLHTPSYKQRLTNLLEAWLKKMAETKACNSESEETQSITWHAMKKKNTRLGLQKIIHISYKTSTCVAEMVPNRLYILLKLIGFKPSFLLWTFVK